MADSSDKTRQISSNPAFSIRKKETQPGAPSEKALILPDLCLGDVHAPRRHFANHRASHKAETVSDHVFGRRVGVEVFGVQVDGLVYADLFSLCVRLPFPPHNGAGMGQGGHEWSDTFYQHWVGKYIKAK